MVARVLDRGVEHSPERLDDLVAFFEHRGISFEPETEGAHRLAAAREELGFAGAEGRLPVETAFAGSLLTILVLEYGCSRHDVEELVDIVAAQAERSAARVPVALFRSAVAVPFLDELPPPLVVEAVLQLLAVVSPATAASLWRRQDRLRCELRAPEPGPTRRERELARAIYDYGAPWPDGRALITGIPILRWDEPVAALVVRAPTDAPGLSFFLRAAADTIARTLARQLLLDQNADRERALVHVAERRLLRLGLDLHDGPIQDVVALAADLRLLRRQADSVIRGRGRPLLGRFDDLQSRLVEMEAGLRQLSHTLEPPNAVGADLETVLRREVATFEQRHDIRAELELEGELGELTDSQHIALYRLVQEALANVRQHAGARRVAVRLAGSRQRIAVSVADDGHGFHVDEALLRAGRKGRLGLIGMSERIRLLGGHFRIATSPSSSTTISASLPRWQPAASRTDAHGASATGQCRPVLREAP